MEQFQESPHGVTCSNSSGNNDLRLLGWRKASPALIATAKLADVGTATAISKTRAILAVKRIGAHIGLKAADLLLLDTLAAFTQTQDWEQGRRPIVWPSNSLLMERTGFSLSTLKRHARRLGQAGILSFHDSSNGKRWGRRSSDGIIVEAYGFDLSPLAAQTEDFENLHTELTAQRQLWQQLKRQITIARRAIRAHLSIAPNETIASNLGRAFVALLDRLKAITTASSELETLANEFADLKHRVEQHVMMDQQQHSPEELTPKEANLDPHIPTTNQLKKENSNSQQVSETRQPDKTTSTKKTDVTLSVPKILQACPEFEVWGKAIGKQVSNTISFQETAKRLRTMIGITDQIWISALDMLGTFSAAAALALVFQKHSTGNVLNPNRYLEGMLRKARSEKLHLDRSLHGLLSQKGT